MKLNVVDAKILQVLLRDGRIGFDELANYCGVTKNQVWKRSKRLEKEGIIKGATVQVNFAHFGFEALATILISVNAQQINQVMESVEKITEVRAWRQYNNAYNIRAVAAIKDLAELDYIKEIIRRRLPTLGLRTYVWTGVRNIPENLDFLSTGRSNECWDTINHTSPEKVTIDAIDRQIIQKLTLDGRMAFTKIAKQLNLSANTVVKRYRNLKENGTIKVSIQIDANKLGYTSILDYNIAFTSLKPMAKDIVDLFAKIPDIIIITKTSGDYDLQVTAMVRDIKQLFLMQDQIAQISGVTQIDSSQRKIPEKWPSHMQYISTL